MNCTVLIVDDSPILRACIKKVVKLAGVDEDHIHEAGNGQEALDVLDTVGVDLVLLDINMPVMNGEEFVEAARTRPNLAGLNIVIVSTEANKDRLARLRALGVTRTLHKPFEPEDLCEIIAETAGARS